MEHRCLASPRTQARELLDAAHGVERVAAEEVLGAVDRPALALVLVAPVRLTLRRAREVEVEVRREPRRARRAREDDAKDVGVLVVVGNRAPEEELGGSAWSEPLAYIATRCCLALESFESRARVAELLLERERVVAGGLDPHEQAVERGDVPTDRVAAALERLHERRPGARKRVEHRAGRPDVPLQQHLDELRDELSQVRMETVDVLRPLALGQLTLGPREIEIQAGVQSLLRRRHRG